MTNYEVVLILYATRLEKDVTSLMKFNGILTLQDLEPENVCEAFKFDLVYHDRKSKCNSIEDYAAIYLDRRLSPFEQRKDFFHEFGHAISHVGDQRRLEDGMLNLQESQANAISLYASMPRYIFEPLATKYRSTEKLQELFQLPSYFIQERIDSIRRERERQLFQHRMQRRERSLRSKSLQPGKVYDSTLSILNQLKNQVGEERLSNEVKRLL